MPKYVRFAAICLSVVLALPLLAADVRPVKTPAGIAKVFPAAAKVRLVNVWATWCVPCVQEMPDLRLIDEAFGPEVVLVGVSLDDMIPDTQPAKVVEFLDRQKVTFPNVYYRGNPDDLGEHLKFSGEIPLTVIYDNKGKELWRHQGRLEREATIARLRDILRRTK